MNYSCTVIEGLDIRVLSESVKPRLSDRHIKRKVIIQNSSEFKKKAYCSMVLEEMKEI